MTKEALSIEPNATVPLLDRLVGPIAARLLADRILLLFDIETGGLTATNPIQPTFAEMLGASREDDYWTTLLSGEDCRWSGGLEGALGLSLSGEICATACGIDNQKTHVLVQLAKTATQAPTPEPGAKTPLFRSIDASVGTITFDLDGNILSLNDRAMTAMEDYGDGLVGQNHDKIWPKDDVRSRGIL